MPGSFEPLCETLLRAGVAPARVRRYERELSEHFCDLVGEEQQAGRSLAEARAAARARLGADETLAGAMLAQPGLRTWTGRAPWATLVVAPFLALILAWILACLAVILLVAYAVHTDGSPPSPSWLPRDWETQLSAALLDTVHVGGPLLIVSWTALLSARQRSPLIWPLLGCVVVALVGASLVWNAQWPTVDPRDPLYRVNWGLGMGFRGHHMSSQHHYFSLAVWSQSLVMASFNLAVAGAVYWTARRRSGLVCSP